MSVLGRNDIWTSQTKGNSSSTSSTNVAPSPRRRRLRARRAARAERSPCFGIGWARQLVDRPAQHEDADHHQGGDGAAVAPQRELEGLAPGVIVGDLGDVDGTTVGQQEDQGK